MIYSGMTCDESLPTRQEPARVYQVRLSIFTPYPDNIRRDTSQVTAGKGGLGFNVSVTNVFDETLDDTVRAEFGRIEIWWDENPAVMKTIPLTVDDEAITGEIGTGNRIVFDPGDSLYLPMIWPFLRDDNSVYMFKHLSLILTSEGYKYPPMDFAAQAGVQLFDRTAMVYSDIIRFRIYFY
jgi:hypothetical protein